MIRARWLLQERADLPAERDWLSNAETTRLAALRFPKRRADWLLGRWTAKRALAASLGGERPLAELEIENDAEGAPSAHRHGRPLPHAVSISHRGGAALCALAPAGVALGCDLELVEPRSEAFVADYFDDDERALLASAPAEERTRLTALVWSAKESALKALGTGLRRDTREVRVAVPKAPALPEVSAEKGWHPLQVSCAEAELRGWWCGRGDRVLTLVAQPSPAEPVALAAQRPR